MTISLILFSSLVLHRCNYNRSVAGIYWTIVSVDTLASVGALYFLKFRSGPPPLDLRSLTPDIFPTLRHKNESYLHLPQP